MNQVLVEKYHIFLLLLRLVLDKILLLLLFATEEPLGAGVVVLAWEAVKYVEGSVEGPELMIFDIVCLAVGMVTTGTKNVWRELGGTAHEQNKKETKRN